MKEKGGVMESSLQRLPNIFFIEKYNDIQEYSLALKGDSKNLDKDLAVMLSITPAAILIPITFSLGSIFLGLVATGTLGCLIYFTINFFRRKYARRILADQKKKYFYDLKEAVSVYNAEADKFNSYVGFSMDSESMEWLRNLHNKLDRFRMDLQRKIVFVGGSPLGLKPVNVSAVHSKMLILNETERNLLLSGTSDSTLLETSTEYKEAMEEIEEEFGDVHLLEEAKKK